MKPFYYAFLSLSLIFYEIVAEEIYFLCFIMRKKFLFDDDNVASWGKNVIFFEWMENKNSNKDEVV